MIYADTSFFVSLYVPDEKSGVADKFVESINDDRDTDISWSPLNRVEVFNTIRQLAFRKNISAADARTAIHSLERDVKAGFFRHQEADWRNVLRRANDVSSSVAFSKQCRAADLLHVAYALELAVDEFITFDSAQAEIANSAGLKTTHLK